MTEIIFNSSDDLENIHILEKKLIERVKRICNIDKLVYVELKNKLIELAENATTETKLKFLLYLCDTGLNIEDIADLMTVLYTHCITHLFIKKLLVELIELRNDINKDNDMTKICEELKINGFNVYTDIINDDKKPAPQKTKPKRKPRTKQPQTEQEKEHKKKDKEQKKELSQKLDLIFNTEPPKEPEPEKEPAGEAPQGLKPEPEPTGEAPQGSKPEKEHPIFKPKRKPRTKKPIIYNETEQKPKISPVEKIELKFY